MSPYSYVCVAWGGGQVEGEGLADGPEVCLHGDSSQQAWDDKDYSSTVEELLANPIPGSSGSNSGGLCVTYGWDTWKHQKNPGQSMGRERKWMGVSVYTHSWAQEQAGIGTGEKMACK